MIKPGRIQELLILRRSKAGLILGDDDDLEVLLPKEENVNVDEMETTLKVFVYHDDDGGLLATTRTPKARAGEFAQMRVGFVDDRGAHMEWGVVPELLVPNREQQKPLTEGRWYIVRVELDRRSNMLYGSTRIREFLDNTALTVQQGDKVDLMVFDRSDIGLTVIVNNKHHGLVHDNEIFRHVAIGDRIDGYVKQVREDNKLDITLQPIGYRQFNDGNVSLIAKRIQARKGFLPLTDKSSAEAIYEEFGISKKAFKMALGALYKQRKVRIDEDGVVWIGK